MTGPSGSSPAFAPNAPVGYTTFLDRTWSPTDGTISGGVLPPATLSGTDSFHCQWGSGSPSVLPIIDTPANISTLVGETVPASPDGHSTIMAVKYNSGFNSGEAPFTINFVGSNGPSKALYQSFYVYLPASWTSNNNNIKWVGFQNDIGNGTGGTANHIMMFESQSSVDDSRAAGMVTQGGGGTNSYGVQGSNASGAITALTIPNPPTVPVPSAPGYFATNRSAWHCIEQLAITETTPGVSSDGVFKSWFDGTLINSWANIRFNAASGDSNQFTEWLFEPLYGGGGGAAPSDTYIILSRTFGSSHT